MPSLSPQVHPRWWVLSESTETEEKEVKLPSWCDELHEFIGLLIVVIGGVFAFRFYSEHVPFTIGIWPLSPLFWFIIPAVGAGIYLAIWESIGQKLEKRKPFHIALREWVTSDAYLNGPLKLRQGLASVLPSAEGVGETLWGFTAWVASDMRQPYYIMLNAPMSGATSFFRAAPLDSSAYWKERAKNLNSVMRFGGGSKSKIDEKLELIDAMGDLGDEEREAAKEVLGESKVKKEGVAG